MELLTAVLAGDRTLEFRVFTEEEVSMQLEEKLTARLCSHMDHFQSRWYR